MKRDKIARCNIVCQDYETAKDVVEKLLEKGFTWRYPEEVTSYGWDLVKSPAVYSIEGGFIVISDMEMQSRSKLQITGKYFLVNNY